MPFKMAIENENNTFLKLIVRVKPQIVADGLPYEEYNLSNIGTHLSAEEFNKYLDKEGTIVVDVRNQYESEVGHFKGAICPDVDTFKESLPIIKDLLSGHEDDKFYYIAQEELDVKKQAPTSSIIILKMLISSKVELLATLIR